MIFSITESHSKRIFVVDIAGEHVMWLFSHGCKHVLYVSYIKTLF